MTDSEKSNVRIQALLNELDRLQFEIKKKKVIIRLIVSITVLAVIIVVAAFNKKTNINIHNTLQVKRGDNAIVKESGSVNAKFKYYELCFEKFNQYPIARFFSENEAISFQQKIKKLDLPETHIHIDSLQGKERVVAISANYRYYIQVGIFKKQLLTDLPENMVYLHQIKDKNLYKYRIGPFTKSTQAKNLIKTLDLKDYLIVEVSN